MSNITLLRIDERLIHGQIVTSWIGHCRADTILIADNTVAEDQLQRDLLTMATPPGVHLEIATLAGAMIFIQQQQVHNSILLLVKTPMVVNTLLLSGLYIQHINVGNMGSKAGRKKYATTLWLTEEEKSSFEQLIDKNKQVSLQVLPTDNPINLNQLLK